MKYTPQIIKEITGYLTQGMNQKDACEMAGIHVDTFHEWMKKTEFSEEIRRAQMACKHRNVALIQKAAIQDWKAGAWWLERKHFDEFGNRAKVEHLIAPEVVEALIAGIMAAVRKAAPACCPSCNTRLDVQAKLGKELLTLSERMKVPA